MKNSTRKLFAIIAVLAMVLSVTVNQTPILPDIPTPDTGIEETEKESEDREPDCGTNCEDDFDYDYTAKF